jgi:hypothetical protein
VIILVFFGRGLDQRLAVLPISDTVRQQISDARNQLLDIRMPESLNEKEKTEVNVAIKESFVDGFRVVAVLSGVMAVTSALFAFFLIKGKR